METMKIGELARRLRTAVSRLRFYEQKGLVHPHRSEGGTRYYTQDDMDRFTGLMALTAVEVPLDRIRALTAIRCKHRSGDAASRQAAQEIAALKRELEDLRARIGYVVDDMNLALRRLNGCHECAKPPRRSICDGCPVAAKLLECQVMRVVWDQEDPT